MKHVYNAANGRNGIDISHLHGLCNVWPAMLLDGICNCLKKDAEQKMQHVAISLAAALCLTSSLVS